MKANFITPREITRAVIESVSRETGVDVADIVGSQRREAVQCRRMVAARLRARGNSDHRIADMMHITVSTVRDYLGRVARQRLAADHDGDQHV